MSDQDQSDQQQEQQSGASPEPQEESWFDATVWRRTWVLGVATIVVGGLLALFQARSDFLESAEYWVSDWAVALAGDQKQESHDKVALALIREETLLASPAYSPVDRRILAGVVRELDQLNPKVIGLDFVFDKENDPAGTRELLEALRAAKTPIVLGRFEDRGGASMIPQQAEYQDWFLAEALKPLPSGEKPTITVGYLNTATEIDDVVRRFAEPWDQAPDRPSFAEALVRAAGVAGAEGSGRIAWLRKASTGFETFPEMRIEQDLIAVGDAEPPLAMLVQPIAENRVVIVGAGFRVMSDYHTTPLDVGLGTETKGVEIQAQMTAQLLDGRQIHEIGKIWTWALSVFVFALAMALTFISSKRWLTEFGVVAVLYLAIFFVVFVGTRTLLPIVGPAAAWAFGIVVANVTMTMERWFGIGEENA